jgi:hypothetical protein
MSVSNFKNITIGEKGLILNYQDKKSKEISFPDIYKIYIKVKKVPLQYILLFVGVSVSAVLFLVWIYGFKWILFSPLFLVLAVVIKLNSHKKYVLKIKLNDGYSIIESIPLKSKYETIEDINKIRKIVSSMR